MTKTLPFKTLCERLEAVGSDRMNSRFLEYVLESEHQGWEGFSSRDLTGVRRFLEDFLLFVENYIEPDGHTNKERGFVFEQESYVLRKKDLLK